MQCGVLGYDLAQGFNELANEMSITGPDGAVCYHHVNSWQTVIQDNDTELASNLTCSVMYEFVNGLLVKLNLTTECCLVNDTACGHHHHGQQNGTNLTEGIHCSHSLNELIANGWCLWHGSGFNQL